MIVIVFAVPQVVGGIASLVVQQSVSVKSSDGRKYRIRLTPTGLRWVSMGNFDMSWFGAPIDWLKRFRRHDHRWTVTMNPKWSGPDSSLTYETCESRRDALRRMDELVAQAERGDFGAAG